MRGALTAGRRTALIACASAAVVVSSMAALSQSLAFDVVSIKPNKTSVVAMPGAMMVGSEPGGRFIMRDGAAVVLVQSAYMDAVDVLGLPEWAQSNGRYDVEAKAGFDATPEQTEQMLRSMLADRFKLRAHYERHEYQTYALRLMRSDGRLGPGLGKYEGDCAAYTVAARAGREKPAMPSPANGAPACGYMMSDRQIVAGGITMERLAGSLRGQAGRIVLDRTGLPDLYEFKLEMSDDVTVFTALREQLGLKLEPEAVAMPVLVVDRIEPPAEN